MKRLEWLLKLADGKPVLFGIAILLIAVSALALVVKNRDQKIDRITYQKDLLQSRCDRRIDSLTVLFRVREIELNNKVESTLNSIIQDYKNRIEEQKDINSKISTTIKDNKRILRNN